MAHRLLLTLLALLTGFAAQIGPAEARVAQMAAQQVSAAFERTAAKSPRAPVALARLPEPGLRNTRRQAPLRTAEPTPIVVRTVLTGIDRAHE
ncbi:MULTISPECIES: hypothetical protein [Novosphingobium]|jgi:hypothetical protein|uniref:Uncharacterized protein n=1 Tax=Novosphingobium panipatense TaxID=428991 RepID=A0ABY1QQA7_9SPHN|nr:MULTISPECIES: hypothetical protein [Novosphingobium]SMP74744.1 hypothetical protein SAMN06296065_107155 [Novosphingobium panipatense]